MRHLAPRKARTEGVLRLPDRDRPAVRDPIGGKGAAAGRRRGADSPTTEWRFVEGFRAARVAQGDGIVTGERLAKLGDRELVALVSEGGGVPAGLGRELLRRLEARGGAPSPPSLRCSAEAWEAFGRRLGRGRRERFWIVALDARNRPVRRHLVAMGTLDHCVVHPREVFGPLVRGGAAGCILVHNHPSGDPTPSVEDEALTVRLVECGRMLGVPVLDHLVVSRWGYVSMRDRGLGGMGAGG